MTKEEIQALIAEMTGGFVTKEDFGKTAAFIRKQGESVEGLSAMLGAIVEKNEDGTFKLKGATPAAPAKKDDTHSALEQQVAALIAANKEKDAKLAEKELNDAVVNALTEAGCVNPQMYAGLVKGSVKRGEDGSFFTVAKDQYGVESNVDLKTSFTGFLKDHPEIAKPAGKPGSGTPSGTPGQFVGGKDIDSLANMPMSEFVAAQSKK
ncbi:MAG: hypothetical protein J0H49_10690 [Acidobacteria bacterium]|nr:hypothetical protein [Acidobacteriota bacterium]